MKNIRVSFLFLCLLLAIALNAQKTDSSSGQINQDSLLFYYNAIINIKDVDNTIYALGFFEQEAKNALISSDSSEVAKYLELVSLGQFKLAFYSESETTTIKALSHLKKKNSNPEGDAARERLTNQLGMIYRKIGDYDNALRFYGQAMDLSSETIDKIAIVTNTANIDADRGSFQGAITLLKPFYEEALKLKDSYIKANYIDNLGFYQSKLNITEGIEHMQMALGIRDKLKDETGLFSSYRHLSNFYEQVGNNKKARYYAENALKIANDLDSPLYQLEAMKLNLKLGKYELLEKYLDLKSKIDLEDQQRKNKYAAIKYNIAESEGRLKDAQIQNEKQKKKTLVYLFGGLFVLLSSVFLYFYLRARHKKDNLQQVYITEKRISKKIHDEVANDVYHVMTKYKSKGDDLLDDLEHIYIKTRDISKENESIDFDEDFGEILSDLLQNYNTENIRVITKSLTTIKWSSIGKLKKTALYRVLQELMTNMRKHSKASLVVLAFEKSNEKVLIHYSDNGIGCNIKKRNGLHNTENRIRTLKGTITFESEPGNGFRAKIMI
ncbi:tetratricopeptide repeat protein [Seonamhaeicola sp. ML3]|uniref:tetratricopeptide repeat-containing sensor histidine kinase n=1 Tax=Seonamhaeicola sp. ML3 TaxID=2937786 RepID=UPI00200BAAC7|nr:tetratricopeptide repeat protein [Seonamhaeicola sp. ML3]